MKNIILYVGGFGLPNRTASAQRALENARLFESVGYKVVLMGKIDFLKDGHIEQKTTDCTIGGIECYDIRHPDNLCIYPTYVYKIDTIKRVIDHYGAENIYAVIAYNYPPTALRQLIKYTREKHIKMIAECTEWHGIEGPGLIRNMIRFFQTEYRMRYLAKKTGNIICASKYAQQYYSGFHAVVLPFVIDTKAQKWQSPVPLSNTLPRRFIYAGSPGMGMSKDHVHKVVEVFAEVRQAGYDFEFTIVGITEEQFLQTFSDFKDKINLPANRINFMGRISHEKTIEQIRQSDFFVFIRPVNRVSQFGFPTKLAEAFSCGVPTITNETSDIGLYIQNKKNGFLLQHPDTGELKAAIIQALMISEEDLQKMKNECLQNNPFHLENFRDQVNEFLMHAK